MKPVSFLIWMGVSHLKSVRKTILTESLLQLPGWLPLNKVAKLVETQFHLGRGMKLTLEEQAAVQTRVLSPSFPQLLLTLSSW